MTNDLEVCQECGWHVLLGHRCQPEEGRLATALSVAVPEVSSTKLGHGGGRITFKIHDGMSLTLEVRDGEFRVRHLFCIESFSVDEAAELVRALAGTAIGRRKIVEEG